MKIALGLAERALGQVAPNPAVGCLIVKAGRIVGRGCTQPGGRPHAETVALDQAGDRAADATAYVTLEPCAHQGATPPCADALIEAGIKTLVSTLSDPDRRVSGAGFDRLRDAGIEVIDGCLAAEAAALNLGFILKVTENRPAVTLKIATSLDGQIATRTGDSKWITGAAARARGHQMRASHDAVLVGRQTAVADNPALTCRLPGLADRSPIRVVADRMLALPPDSTLVAGAETTPTWVLCHTAAAPEAKDRLDAAGVRILEVDLGADGMLDPASMLARLAEAGLTRVLIEGGGRLAAALLAADLVDRLEWFRGGCLVGGDGVAAIGPLGLAEISAAPRFQRIALQKIGDDLLETFVRQA